MKSVLLPKTVAAFILASTFTSCISVTYPEPSSSELEMGRTLTPKKNKSLVVAYRNSSLSLTTGQVPTRIILDDEMIGATKEGTFATISLDPGKHTFNGNRFQAEADKTYFFRQSVKNEIDGWIFVPTPAPVPKMVIRCQPVPETVGRAEVKKLKQTGMGQIQVKTM